MTDLQFTLIQALRRYRAEMLKRASENYHKAFALKEAQRSELLESCAAEIAEIIEDLTGSAGMQPVREASDDYTQAIGDEPADNNDAPVPPFYPLITLTP